MDARKLWILAVGGVVLGGVAGCQSLQHSMTSHDQPAWSSKFTPPPDAPEVKPAPEPKIRPVTHYAAARLFEQHRQYAQAIEQYRRAIALNHAYVQAYNRLGMLLDRLGRFEQADMQFKRALQVQPDNPQLRNNLGFSYLLQRRWADAETELRKAVELQPDFARARTNLGVVLAYRGRYREALEEFRKVMPEAHALYNLGLVLQDQQRYEEAAATFTRVLELDERFAAARIQLDRLAAYRPAAGADESATAGVPAFQVPPVVRELPRSVEPASADIGRWSPRIESASAPQEASLPQADERLAMKVDTPRPAVLRMRDPVSAAVSGAERKASQPPRSEASSVAAGPGFSPLTDHAMGRAGASPAAERPALEHVEWDTRCLSDAIEFINLLTPAPVPQAGNDKSSPGSG